MMWIVKEDVCVFSAIPIHNEKGNKENKNQPIGDKDKNCLECVLIYFECVLPFTIHIHDRSANLNGFGIKRRIFTHL
jgi:hypothetical protein